MASYKITYTVDAHIELCSVSAETFARIQEFLAREIPVEKSPYLGIIEKYFGKTEVGGKKAAVDETDGSEEVPAAVEMPEEKEVEWHELTRQQKTMRGMKAYAPVLRILDDARANPKGYEWRWEPARVFCEEWREVEGLDNTKNVGVVLSGIADEGVIEKQGRDAEHRDRLYFLPFPVVSAEEREPDAPADSIGSRIRTAREWSGFTVKEIADMIAYPADVIRGWESGKMIPSKPAKAELENLFGKSLFDGIDVEIWN